MSAQADARAQLVACAQRIWERGLVTGSSGNVSLRLPDGDLLVTPRGRALRALRSDDLVHIAPDGRLLPGQPPATTELALHLAAYRVRPEIACVVHAHPTFCVVWSKSGRVFAGDTVGARERLGPVAFVPYAPPGSEQLAQGCARAFADGSDVVLMERHGISSVGVDLERAFLLADLAEEAARIAYFSHVAGFADAPT